MKKQSGFRRLVALALTLCMLAALTAEIFAADIIDSGYCGGEGDGTNLTWTFDSNGVLTIRGTGRMKDYSKKNNQEAPWRPILLDSKFSNMKEIRILDGVESVGNYAFYDLHYAFGLKSIYMADSVTSIGSYAFSEILEQITVTLSENLQVIGDHAFYLCYMTGTLDLPESVVSVGSGAFFKCIYLDKVIIHENTQKFDGTTFAECKKLTTAGPIGSNCSIEYAWTDKIPDRAFNGCNNLLTVQIADGIREIGAYALASCGIKEIDIPSSVQTIGNSAFARSELKEIEIPESVKTIGDKAFEYCQNIESITMPSGATTGKQLFNSCKMLKTAGPVSGDYNLKFGWEKTIPREAFAYGDFTDIYIPDSIEQIEALAFERCSSLSHIVIAGEKTRTSGTIFTNCPNLTSAGPIGGNYNIEYASEEQAKKIFIGADALKTVVLPDSMEKLPSGMFGRCSSLINVDLPVNLKEIDTLVFSKCKSLKKIVIPAGTTRIWLNAFPQCDQLTEVYFEGNAPKINGLNENYEPSFPSIPTLYYKKDCTGWTDSSAYDAAAGTWHGYPLKTWDGKTIPEETKVSVPTGKYCIRAIDESGNPVSDATVWWNGSRAVTDENGDAFVDLMTVGEPVIRVVKSGYIEWTNKNSNWKKSDTRFEQVILYPKSYGKLKLKYAKISDKFDTNLVIQTKVLNLRNDGALIGDLNSGYFDLSCAATDTSDVTGYAVYQNKKEIAKSTDGNFQKLDVRDFVEGGGCFVRVTGANGQTMDTRINLQFAKNSVNEDFKFELKGNHISFDVSDDVPYIGGTTVSFGLPLEVPVVASATTDKMQFGINLKLNPDKSKEEQIDSYIKNIKKLVTVKGVKRSKANAKALKNCAAQHNKAEFFKDYDITVCGYAEADFGSNTASGYILFIVDRQLVDYEYNTVIVIPLTAVPLVFPITVQVGAELSLEAGAAVSYKFDTRTWNGNVVLNPSVGLTPFVGVGYSKVTGVGVYGDADLSAKINLLGKNSGCQNVDLTGEFGAKGYFGPWEWHKPFAHQTWHIYTANTVKSNSLSSGAAAWDADLTAADFIPSDLSYLAAESDWVPASAQTYAAGRAAQLKASYQTLLQNTYRNAQPVMISDGSALYAAFVRADADTGVRYVALTKFDGNSWSEPVRVDAGAILDDAPQLCTDGQTLWLAYARTTQDSGYSLVSYAQNQTIVVGTINKNTLAFTEQKTYQSDDYMRLPTLSCMNGTPVLAWVESAVTDEESVVNPAASTVYTAEYRGGAWLVAHKAADAAGVDSICIGAQNGAPAVAYTADGKLYCGSRLLAENVTGRAIYGRLPGTTADTFIWNADSALHDEAGNTVPVEGLGRDFVIVGDSIYFNQTNGANANLAALHYDAANDHWSAPILLIGDKQYLENLKAAELNGKTYALGMHTTVTITADDVDDAKDLVWTQILPVSDLKLSDVSFDADALVPGETLPVTFTVTNSGDHTVSSLTLTANGVNTAQDCNLLPGESAEFTVNITCPSEKRTVAFAVQESGQDDYTPEDNTTACTVGSADAEVELALLQIGSRKFLQAVVVNRGLEPASGSVLFAGPDGQTLAERTFQNLTYGGTVIAEYEPDSFAALYGEDVTATVRLQQDEPNMLNNTDSVPVLLTSTEILSAQRTGTAVTAEIACMQDGARAICAFYAADGRLLRTVIQPLESGKINSLTFQIDSNAAQAKLFVLDAKNAPAAPARSIPLNS